MSLFVETDHGCEAVNSGQVFIANLPEANFSFNPLYGEAPVDISFINQSNNASSYSWDFGVDSASVSVQESPTYTYGENGIYNITLLAINEFGCSDYTSSILNVVPTELDIEIAEIAVDLDNLLGGETKAIVTVELANVGSRLIENTELVLSSSSGNSIFESWTGFLPSGINEFYTLNGNYTFSEFTKPDYLCVEAKYVNNDSSEVNLSNNKACVLLDGVFQTSLPYPNPSKENLYVDVIAQSSSVLDIKVVDMVGKVINTVQDLELVKGYNKLSISTETLARGKYFIQLQYLQEDYLLPFIVDK